MNLADLLNRLSEEERYELKIVVTDYAKSGASIVTSLTRMENENNIAIPYHVVDLINMENKYVYVRFDKRKYDLYMSMF